MTSRIREASELRLPPCPTCRALASDPCRTPTLRTTKPHRARLSVRVGSRLAGVAPSRGARADVAAPTRALGDDVRGERRLGAGVVRDDEHRVLAKRVPDVRRKAARLADKRGATGRVVLGTVDVERDTGLALPEEHAARRRDGEAGEVLRGRRGNRGLGLASVDVPTKRRAAELLPLAEADDDTHLTGGDGPTERHVLSVSGAKARSKGWQTTRYLLIWFVVDHEGRKARLTLEGGGLDGLPDGWRELPSGEWRRTVAIEALAEELERVGRLLEGH